MEVQRLSADVIKKLRGSACTNSFTQCVTELVLNSIDSKATAISVRINLFSMRIQVVDNGEGISKDNLKVVGQRYYTNKCKNWMQLDKQIKYYGFRGETLANISECSQTINIISKHILSIETFGKTLSKKVSEEVKLVKNRPSTGTTITVESLFYNLPVRRKRIIVELELEAIKKIIESLIIIHPNISFTVRNDITSELILKSNKSSDIISSLKNVHPNIEGDFNLIKVAKDKVKVEALLCKELSADKKLQFTYLNKRPFYSMKIQKLAQNLFLKNFNKETRNIMNTQFRYPVFLINIKCPYTRVYISVNDDKTNIEFKDWESVKKCIEKLIYFHFGKKIPDHVKQITAQMNYKPASGVSQIKGAYKGCGYKRKEVEYNNENEEMTSGLVKEQFNNNKSEHYTINNSTSPINIIRRKIKKPLPVETKIVGRVKCNQIKPKKGSDIVSGLTKFTNDENKGKTFIMDMFLKSTQAFKSNENLTDTLSEGTVYEEESNVLMQNNIFTSINGKNRTTSVSVNVRSTKKIRKSKIRIHKQSKGIQTSPENYNSEFNLKKMIQCEVHNDSLHDLNPENYTVQFMNSTCNKNPVFTFVYKEQKQHQNSKLNTNFDSVISRETCNCNCHSKNTKIFSFPKNETPAIQKILQPYRTETKLKAPNQKYVDEFQSQPCYYNLITNNRANICSRIFKNGTVELISKKCDIGRANFWGNTSSPYFTTNQKTQNTHLNNKKILGMHSQEQSNTIFEDVDCIGPYKKIDHVGLSTQYNKYNGINFKKGIQNNISMDKMASINMYRDDESANLLKHFSQNTQNICRFSHQVKHLTNYSNMQVNVKPSTKYSNSYESNLFSPLINEEQESPGNEDQDLKAISDDNVCLNKNPIREKQLTLEMNEISPPINQEYDIDYERKQIQDNEKPTTLNRCATEQLFSLSSKENDLHENEPISRMSQNIDLRDSDRQNCGMVIGLNEDDWSRKYNNFGNSFYVNRKTGFITYGTPKQSDKFHLEERYDFLPKGLSPILTKTKPVDTSLSQRTKGKLLEYIMETYKNELLYVKWQNDIKGTDPTAFFENFYKEKLKMLDNIIPNITTTGCKLNHLKGDISLDKECLKNISIIGQVDNKFIAAIKEDDKLLLLFDQHAVDERIRLEKLSKVYRNSKSICKEKLTLFIPQNDLSLLKKHCEYWKTLGLSMEFFGNGVNISEIPKCLYKKINENEGANSVLQIIQILVNQILEILKLSRGATYENQPKILQNVINLEACRGAIKFGDPLSKFACEKLLEKLSHCDLPFQCAHGRPTLTPLLYLKECEKIEIQKPKLQQLMSQQIVSSVSWASFGKYSNNILK